MTDRWPSVGVIIPNHRRVDELRQAISSVRSQDYEGPVRIHLVYQERDGFDASGLQSPDLTLHRYEPSPSAAPIAAQRNVGIAAAEEELIAFLDDDDLWHPAKLRRQVEALVATHAVACGTGWSNFTTESGPPAWVDRSEAPPRNLSVYEVARSGRLMTSSLLIDGEVARSLPFDERVGWHGLDDYDLKLRLIERGPVVVLPEILTALRVDATSDSRTVRALHFARALDVFAAWAVTRKRSAAMWRALLVRLGVTAMFPGHDPDPAAVEQLRATLNGQLLGPLDRPVAWLIEACWRSTRVAPTLRRAIPARLLQ